MKVFMDDDRQTPEGWIRTFNIEETFLLLKTRRISHLSLDNDLGSLDPKTEGFNILNTLEQWAHDDPTFPIPIITIHSANAARVQSMKQAAAKLETLRQQRIANETK